MAPDSMPGFEAGAAAYRGRIPAPDGAMREVDATLFASYVHGGLEVRGEWAQMQHRRITGGQGFNTGGWYALASFRPRGWWTVFRPYVFIDRLDVDSRESYLSGVHDQRSWSAGVRWDAARRLAIKGELRSHLKSGERELEARAQIAFSF
jgi:hypothetical protein